MPAITSGLAAFASASLKNQTILDARGTIQSVNVISMFPPMNTVFFSYFFCFSFFYFARASLFYYFICYTLSLSSYTHAAVLKEEKIHRAEMAGTKGGSFSHAAERGVTCVFCFYIIYFQSLSLLFFLILSTSNLFTDCNRRDGEEGGGKVGGSTTARL